MLAMFVCYWSLCRKRPQAALLFAILPLFLAWRSLPSYFYCIAYPIFILLVHSSRGKVALRVPQLPTLASSQPALPDKALPEAIR